MTFGTIDLFIIRNAEGKYFRAKGYGGYGETWTDDIKRARIYTRIATARARVTFFANSYPEFPIPKLFKLIVTGLEEMDETERVQKTVAKKKNWKEKRELRNKKWQLEAAQREFAAAKERLERCNI